MRRPHVDRPQISDYGVPDDTDTMLTWEEIRRRLEASAIYWLGTVRPSGRPHSVPLWGAWIDDELYFDGGAHTRHLRNLAENPWASVHLESGLEVVILEGRVTAVSAPDPTMAVRLASIYTAKYRQEGYAPEPSTWDEGGLYRFEPEQGWAWTSFPRDATRFRFGPPKAG